MRTRSVLTLAALAIAAFLAAVAASRALAHREPDAATVAAAPAAAARTAFPGLVAATGEPALPSLTRLHPAPLTVTRASGPFDDRFTLSDLRFDGTQVRGSARVTSDVSDLLELEVVAGFYDRRGTLIGTGRHIHHLDESSAMHSGPPAEVERFAIPVPAKYRGAAVSAAVGIPVLVNE